MSRNAYPTSNAQKLHLPLPMIRTLVHLDSGLSEYKRFAQSTAPFFIEPMPHAPRIEDMVNLKTILGEQAGRLSDAIKELHWMAHIIEWDKDQEGYFIHLTLMGQ